MTRSDGLCRVPDCEQITTAYVCDTCAHRLAVALGDVPALLAELDVEITRQARRGRLEGTARRTEVPLPLDPAASEARDVLVRTLGVWRRTLAGNAHTAPERPVGPACRVGCGHGSCARHRAAQPLTHGTTVAALLRTLIPDIRLHPEGGHLVDEITAAVDQARAHLYRGDTPGATLAGLCPDCSTPVYARPDAQTARCHTPDCPGLVDTAQWRATARTAIDDQLMSAADASRALDALGIPVSAARIRQWGSRRGRRTAAPKLLARWVDPHGRPLYRVGDIRTLLTPNTTTRKETA